MGCARFGDAPPTPSTRSRAGTTMVPVIHNTDTVSAPILVGVDGSEHSHDALVLAARLAEAGRDLLLVHVR